MRRVRAVLLAVVASTAVACRAPTEIRVEVTTDEACSDWHGAALAVGELGAGLENAIPATSTTSCDDAGHVGAVVVIPSGSDGEDVAFKVVGAVDHGLEACTVDAGYSGCIVARRALRFIPHETLTLSVPLLTACKDVPCTETETCVDRVCRPATIVDPTQCESTTCRFEPTDGGAPFDATVNDGSVSDGGANDATVSDGSTGDDDGPGGGDDGPGTPIDVDAAAAGCGQNCAVTAGEFFSCALRDGGVVCWGQDDLGESGNQTGDATPATVGPGAVLAAAGGALTGARGIVSGWDTSCAFVAGGAVACWGGGSPLGNAGDVTTATSEALLSGAPLVAIGNYHSCWQQPGGQITCECQSGCDNAEGQAYNGDGGATVPIPLTFAPAIPPFAQLESNRYFTCLLNTAGTVYCLGDNNSNESDPSGGSGTTVTTFTGVSLTGVREIGLTNYGACARAASNVYCWGDYGQPGGPTPTSILFADGGALTNTVRLSAGFLHVCAILSNGTLACWGDNAKHQLGRGESTVSDGVATGTAGLVVNADGGVFAGVTAVAVGEVHTCAMKTDGTTWCWGDNAQWQLGQGSAVPAVSSTPIRVAY